MFSDSIRLPHFATGEFEAQDGNELLQGYMDMDSNFYSNYQTLCILLSQLLQIFSNSKNFRRKMALLAIIGQTETDTFTKGRKFFVAWLGPALQLALFGSGG